MLDHFKGATNWDGATFQNFTVVIIYPWSISKYEPPKTLLDETFAFWEWGVVREKP